VLKSSNSKGESNFSTILSLYTDVTNGEDRLRKQKFKKVKQWGKSQLPKET
jgi:hypothetical protein